MACDVCLAFSASDEELKNYVLLDDRWGRSRRKQPEKKILTWDVFALLYRAAFMTPSKVPVSPKPDVVWQAGAVVGLTTAGLWAKNKLKDVFMISALANESLNIKENDVPKAGFRIDRKVN